ncbi:MAG: HesA/MoeB/ThiF family protein [Flavisolibacter sp.]|nr:HesA/MoeB/ThiF family protein [Flavisolibacter sp.]
MVSNEHNERYQRQVILQEFGEAGQQKLLQAKVLVIGAGGLGCPVLQYLAAAGVGVVGIADDDIVSLTNLHRQVLYSMSDIGKSKVERAAAILRQLNPDIEIIPYHLRLTNKNALDIIAAYDIVVDATDNFPTRYLLNDACVLLSKPLIYGAVSKFEGQVAVFNGVGSSGEKSVNYRDLFPVPPQEDEVPNCAEAGVLGVLPGIIGSLQAGEVIKLITGIGQPLINCLQTFNLLTNEWYTSELTKSAETAAFLPKDRAAFLNMDYEWSCAVEDFSEINAADFNRLLDKNGVTVIDVRERGEQPLINEFEHLQLPLAQLNEGLSLLKGDIIIAVCQSGKRSKQAARLLCNTFPSKKIYSLQGGIVGWKQQFQKEKL